MNSLTRVRTACGVAALVIATVATRTAAAQDAPIVIHTSRTIDGRGKTLTDVDITVVNGKITRVGPKSAIPAGAREIDLRGRTVLPGLIDAHAHLTWYFNRQGRYHTNSDGDTPIQSILAAAANAYATLMAGFTTIQSPGSQEDKDLREWITTQGLAGPRILTSLTALQGGTPDTLRARVRLRKQQGADLIKIFASASIRDGGKQSMTDAQLAAVCGEAKAQGLRSVVHAHSAESVRAVVNAGCDQIEHGVFVTQAELDLMAEKGTWFDPQCSLVFRNYLDNRAKYDGIGNYNAEGFAAMERAIPLAADVIRKAIATKGLKMVYGTDAVAGAHGRNAEDLVCRVQSSGQKPMAAIVSATSLSAQSLGLGATIGTLKAGYEADIIAVDGDPAKDITALRRVSFVMKGGRVVRDDGHPGGK
jgi:imidazolonepropionase-like amidohydrolase